MGTLFVLVIGIFIGWNFPQPTYAKLIQSWIVSKFKDTVKEEK